MIAEQRLSKRFIAQLSQRLCLWQLTSPQLLFSAKMRQLPTRKEYQPGCEGDWSRK